MNLLAMKKTVQVINQDLPHPQLFLLCSQPLYVYHLAQITAPSEDSS